MFEKWRLETPLGSGWVATHHKYIIAGEPMFRKLARCDVRQLPEGHQCEKLSDESEESILRLSKGNPDFLYWK